jgi:hypothetical protein
MAWAAHRQAARTEPDVERDWRMEPCSDTAMLCRCGGSDLIQARVRYFYTSVWAEWRCSSCNRREIQEVGEIDPRVARVPAGDILETELAGKKQRVRFVVYG